MSTKPKPDAAESNAGDDFHILWTVRKSFDLLNFDEKGLKVLTVEGLTSTDNTIIDETGGALLGVDLTEYYGGEDFTSACQIVISQLKYSTRQPDKEWTAAQICTDNKGDSVGSIIRRLSNLFLGLVKQFTYDEVLKKVQVKLVSNRPVSTTLSSAVQRVQKFLSENPEAGTLKVIKGQLDNTQQKEIDRIVTATNLDEKKSITFLQVLDFADCGTGSRQYQKQQIIKAICDLGSRKSDVEYAQLKELVWNKMMPDQRAFNELKQEDLLFKFGLNDIADLFPVPSRIEKTKNLVVREQLENISKTILNESTSLICLHAGAGIGKSTLATQIHQVLPESSVSVLFDCYGNGAYDDPADKRHKHQRAFVELINDLALKIGTQFIVKTDGEADFYIREFKKRLTKAIEIVRSINPAGIVAIIIDAADNSVSASLKYNESCFIHDLVLTELPIGCKLIVTTRTSRVPLLKLPKEHTNILIQNFSFQETAKLLLPHFPNLTDNEVNEFWVYTKGIPRVMVNALDVKGNTLQEKISFLKPEGKSLIDLFKDRVKETGKKVGDTEALDRFLTLLTSLPTPIPVEYVQEIGQVSDSIINDLCTDLWHGIVYTHNKLSFRDEDFETYLKEEYIPGINEYQKISDFFLTKAERDEYASIHLGFALSKANRKQELIKVVLERSFLIQPKDPVRSKEVFVERARLGMRLCSTADIEFLKMQMIAAEAAKTNKVLEDILIKKAELAAVYGNIQTNQKIYFQSGNPEWFGPAHYRNAVIFSKNTETHKLAETHLVKARRWLDFRRTLDQDEQENYRIEVADIACGAEAVLRITDDANECIEWILNWQPREILYNIVSALLTSLITNSEINQIEKWFKKLSVRVDVELLIINKFFQAGLPLPINTKSVLSKLTTLKRFKLKFSEEVKQYIISFCECLLMMGEDYLNIKDCLLLCDVPIPSQTPSFYGKGSYLDLRGEHIQMDAFFRKRVLIATQNHKQLSISELLPNSIIKNLKSKDNKLKRSAEEDKKVFELRYKHLLPVYEFRIKALLRTDSLANLDATLDDIISRLSRDHELEYNRAHQLPYFKEFMAIKLIDAVFYRNHPEWIDKIKKSYSARDKNKLDFYLALSEKISLNDEYRTDALRILSELEGVIKEMTLPASNLIETYTEATTIASRISKDAGQHYFDLMVNASNEVDLEAQAQISCLDKIIKGKQFNRPDLAFKFARYIEYCYERISGWDHFPWEDAFNGVAKLDTGAAFVVMSQWDHREVRNVNSNFLQILTLALKHNFIDHTSAASLLPINETYWDDELIHTLKLILDGFDDSKDHSLKNLFVSDIIRDLKLNCTSENNIFLLRKFLALIKNSKFLNSEIVIQFEKYCTEVEELSGVIIEDETKDSNHHLSTVRVERSEDYIEQVNEVDYTSTIALEELIDKLRQGSINMYVDEELLFSLVAKRVPDNLRLSYLNALSKISSDYLGYFDLEKVFKQAFSRWDVFTDVKQWKEDAFQSLLRSRFSTYYNHDNISVWAIKELADTFNVSSENLSSAVIAIIPEHLDVLSAQALYQLFYITTTENLDYSLIEFIEWTLEQWNNKIKEKESINVFSESIIDNDAHFIIPNFIRYHLGHPDKRIRWKSAHCLRRFIRYNNTEVLHSLIEKQNETDCHPCQNPAYPFYWISAKLYLWITIDRVSKENPQAIINFSDAFLSELSNKELPHVLIQYFIQSTCLSLKTSNSLLFTDKQSDLIQHFFKSKFKPVKETKEFFDQIDEDGEDELTRFKFDSLDTLPYWYGPLGEVFGISASEVSLLADKYISEYWGYSGNLLENDHLKNTKYDLVSNRHGSSTTVENLRIYLEYHAMFCAADELIRTKPVVLSDWGDEWEEWLNKWTLQWENTWLSDIVDPIPLEKRFWNKHRETENWEWRVSMKDFETSLGLSVPIYPNYFPIYSRTTVYYGEDYETCSIRSALVNSSTALALLRTLQTTSRHNYSVPLEENEHYHDADQEHSEMKFKMVGWVKSLSSGREGIDEYDISYYDFNKERQVVGSQLTNYAQLNFSNDLRFSYEQDGNFKASILESWTNLPSGRKYYDLFASNGNRLFLHKEILISFLKSKKKSLIISCEILRRPKHKENEYDDLPYYTLILILQSDGTIKTLSKSYSIR